MDHSRRLWREIAGVAVIILITLGLVYVIRTILPRESTNQVASSQTAASAYPPPIETTLAPSPTIARTDIFPWELPTMTPYPITPFPTLTLVPGPSPTPIPLVQPAENAAGTIYFVLNNKDDSKSSIFYVGVDSVGKTDKTSTRLSEVEPLADHTIFVSPDGIRIAIIGPWGTVSIYNLLKGESENTSLPPASGDGKFYSWFPDNRRILWSAGSLKITDPFSGERAAIAVPGYGHVTAAAVSPDGQSAVYAYSTDILYPKGLWIVNTNGQNARLLVKDVEPYNISWSPDGKRIVFFAAGWKVVDADGSNLREIAQGVFLPQCYFLPALWSPDSSTLAVVTSKSGQAFCNGWSESLFTDTNIMLIDVESGESRPLLADGSQGNIDPAWSPDGSMLAFISNRGGSAEIWVVNKDGTDLHPLTELGSLIRFPVWQRASR